MSEDAQWENAIEYKKFLKGARENVESMKARAGNVPILAKMADISSKLQLRILDSDAHAEYHQQFKVNGKRKTPVVLLLSPKYEELCRWVERPNAAYKVIN